MTRSVRKRIRFGKRAILLSDGEDVQGEPAGQVHVGEARQQHRSKRELLVCPFECDQIKILCGKLTSSPTASVSFCRCEIPTLFSLLTSFSWKALPTLFTWDTQRGRDEEMSWRKRVRRQMEGCSFQRCRRVRTISHF